MGAGSRRSSEQARLPGLGFLSALSPHMHWALRIALASTFVFHGLPKFAGLSQFAESSNLPIIVALLVPIAEVGGALLVLLGGLVRGALGDLATRLGALAFLPVMVGAIAMMHWPRWSFEPSSSFPVGGMEFQVILILISLYLLVKGNDVTLGRSSSART